MGERAPSQSKASYHVGHYGFLLHFCFSVNNYWSQVAFCDFLNKTTSFDSLTFSWLSARTSKTTQFWSNSRGGVCVCGCVNRIETNQNDETKRDETTKRNEMTNRNDETTNRNETKRRTETKRNDETKRRTETTETTNRHDRNESNRIEPKRIGRVGRVCVWVPL